MRSGVRTHTAGQSSRIFMRAMWLPLLIPKKTLFITRTEQSPNTASVSIILIRVHMLPQVGDSIEILASRVLGG